MPVTRRPLGRSKVTRRFPGLSKGTTAAPVRGRSESPERRGRIAPSPTKATSPRPGRSPRRCSWSRSRVTCSRRARRSRFRCSKEASATRGRRSVRSLAAWCPRALRPEAGRPTSMRASTRSAKTATLVRSSTSWPGRPMPTNPPFPVPSGLGIIRCAASANRRVRKSETAVLPAASSVRSAGRSATSRLTMMRIRDGGA